MNEMGEPGWWAKGLPLDVGGGTGTDVGWSVFGPNALLPLAVVRASAVTHNSRTMAAYCGRHGVSIAPHGKTTMTPALFRRQLADGAWGITAATVWQASIMRTSGVRRILIANEVVTTPEIRWLGEVLDETPSLDVFCYVDSAQGVALMDDVLRAVAPSRPLPVLLERGLQGGRAGVRSTTKGLEVAQAVMASSHLTLCGTASFEGIIVDTAGRCTSDLVDEFLDEVVALTRAIDAMGGFDAAEEVILTAGGSAFFDHVVERFSLLELERPIRVVIRSGCYLTHSEGHLGRSPMGPDETLRPAIEVWGAVLSRPEPTRAIIGVGKRDASPDGVLPVAKLVRRRSEEVVREIEPIVAVSLNDQHAYLDLDPKDPLAIGDLVGFGVSHPCTTFDKWRVIPLVDDEYRVQELLHTYF